MYISFVCLVTARRGFFSPRESTFEFWVYCYVWEISILIRLVPSDADDGDGDGDGDNDDGVPTTLPAWPRPRGYHAQGSNIPFGESLTLI